MGETAATVSNRLLGEVASGSAPGMAADLVALFGHLSLLPDKVQWVQRRIAEDLGDSLDATLDRACAAVATVIDADAGAFDRQPYHNRQHFCEVALTAYVLCMLKQMDVRDTQFVLLAALIHDVVQDGRPHAAFLQERASVEQVRGMLEAAGVDESQMRRLKVLVLTTHSPSGSAFMAAACRSHDRADGVFPAVPQAAPELAELIADRRLSELSRTLCEADILPSVGLTTEHAMRLQERLAHEWGRPLGVQDKLDFMDAVLAQDFIGEFFMPNVRAIRAALARAANANA